MASSDWNLCRFSPLDVVVTADARPLDVGGFGQTAELAPGALAGSLRTLILKNAGYTAQDGVLMPPTNEDAKLRAARVAGFSFDKNATVAPSLRFVGPLYADIAGRLLLPAPQSALRANWRSIPVPLVRSPAAVFDDALGECRALVAEEQPSMPLRELDVDAGWWSVERVAWWLKRTNPGSTGPDDLPVAVRPDPWRKRKEIAADERRSGHARGRSGAPEEGALFSRSARRFVETPGGVTRRSAGYAALVAGDDGFLPPGSRALVRLGGDGHVAQVAVGDFGDRLEAATALLDEVIRSVTQGARSLQMYLVTPAIFGDGWRPRFDSAALRLQAAAVGRPVTLAGWDLRRSRPKAIRRAAPAGAVYVFEIVDREGAVEIVRRHHLSAPLPQDDGDSGTGFALFGTWRWSGSDE